MKSALFILVCATLVSQLTIAKTVSPPDLSTLPATIDHGLPAVPPEVNEIIVEENFGHDLSALPEQLENFLLGVSFDKVTAGSITAELPIGIPYIVYTGRQYWINQFTQGKTDLSTLLNTTLILLLSSDDMLLTDADINIDATINSLLIQLEKKGYWPAAYMLAEHTILASTFRQVSMPEQIETINRLFACAEVVFAPCQIRLGLQLIQNKEAVDKAERLLRSGLAVYDADPRYHGHDLLLTQAARNFLKR